MQCKKMFVLACPQLHTTQNIVSFRVLKVIRKKPDMEDQIVMKKKREWDELEEAVGFSKVAKMISQSVSSLFS